MRTSWKARGMWVEEGWALNAHRAKSEHRFRLHRCRLPSRWAGAGGWLHNPLDPDWGRGSTSPQGENKDGWAVSGKGASEE